jgi:hypothetical protein
MAHIDATLIEDIGVFRHWHAHSQKFAGGDCLATMLFLGWKFNPLVMMDTYWHFGTRQVHVYHFELLRDDESVTMPVIGNPYVDRLIAHHHLEVVPIDRSERLRIKRPVKELEYVQSSNT